MKISFEKRYFSFNRIILLATGLWPYQQSKVVQLQLMLFFSILLSFIAFQLSRLLFVEYTFNFTIKILCVSLYIIFFAIKYISFWINKETIKCLLEQLQYIYNDLKDKNEIAIYDKYGNIAKRITITFIIGEISCLCTLSGMQWWPWFLDMIIPKNETYTHHLIVLLSKYYDVQEKYYYFILLHLSATITVGSFALVAVATMMLSYAKHICGMFRIASYRLEQAMTINTLQSISLKTEIVIYKEIVYAVDIHRKAMKFAKFLINSMERSFLSVIMITVLCVSFNLYRISQTESFTENVEETLIHLLIITFTLLYMFLANYTGQEITDYNNHVSFTAYNIPWYQAPLHIQKLILVLIQRSNKTFTLNIGGLFTLSLECFASLLSTSVSYFTVMLSLQY
ncbi:hypothetical protein DMN91_003854 [Ooceraea biroi]|uniref:Odorant receptor n=4 Tax=Ooceraea biroi TaxID=2015173 RepID=A0A3L8DV79_OOCBI|nr:hypothetical protein DMN91_003854 [Ooceraea biroi]